MKDRKKYFLIGSIFVMMFALLTILIMTVDVQPVGQNGTDIGFAGFNTTFHEMTGVNMLLYTITDWLGLVPILICMIFGGVGFIQLVKRKSLLKVDKDIIILGIYYIIVIMAYLIFEMIPINYRPVPIEGIMEASYPSSTTLLVLSVMPTLVDQTDRRISDSFIKKLIGIFAVLFSIFMVTGRLISGVHWFTDIIGSIILSIGLYYMYKGCVLSFSKEA